MTSIAPSSRDVQTIVNDDGAAILNIERGSISTLNPTGAFVWQGLERGETLELIIANLVRDTGKDEPSVDRDVREFVKALTEKHLLPR